MRSGTRYGSRQFRPVAEAMETRVVMSVATAREVARVLRQPPANLPVRPNTPVLPLESPASRATFIDPSVQIIKAKHIALGQKDYIAPYVSLDSRGGFIKVGSSSTIQDNATLVANPDLARRSGGMGITIGDNVVVGAGSTIIGPSTIGGSRGAATSIGANAIIDGARIQPGSFVGALARVGPGVTINPGVRVLPGANVTNQAEATDPALGKIVFVTSTDPAVMFATTAVSRNTALAGGYSNLYQGDSATGPGSRSGSGGPVPDALIATGVNFGALNTVLGVSGEPGSKSVSFEPSSGTPLFQSSSGSFNPLAQNIAFRVPARIIGNAVFSESIGSVRAAIGRRDSIRADEGQPIVFYGPIAAIGSGVTIHSPNGGVRTTTTTTVVTSTTANGATTTTTNTSTVVTSAAPTATPGTTTAITTGVNAAGVATTGTVTTTIATSTTTVGDILFGSNFRAGDHATILGGPSQITSFGDHVTVGTGAVVETAMIGSNVIIGDRAYVANSVIPAGTVVPAGAIIVNNVLIGMIGS